MGKARQAKRVQSLVNRYLQLSWKESGEFLRSTGVLDLRLHLAADVRIDAEDTKSPIASYVWVNGYEESIDIIDTVRQNAFSIGDPRVLHAIRRWQNIVLFSSALKLRGQAKFVKDARRNLEALGKALLSGSTSRASGAHEGERALLLLGLNDEVILLEIAWELLAKEAATRFSREKIHYRKVEASDGTKTERRRPPKHTVEIIAKELRVFEMFDGLAVEPHVSVAQRDLLQSKLVFFTEPGNKLSERERRLAVLLRLNEFVQVPLEASKELESKTPVLSSRNIPGRPATDQTAAENHSDTVIAQYVAKPISTQDLPEHARKTRVDWIVEFLKGAGRPYIQRRPRWQAFLNQYLAWRTNREHSVVKKHHTKARASAPSQSFRADTRFLIPELINSYRFAEMRNWLSFPSQPARDNRGKRSQKNSPLSKPQ